MRLSSSLSLVFAMLTVACLSACGSPEPPKKPADSYQVRGIVRQLPKAPGQELYIHHEEIPTFVNIDGEVQGMGSMAMPFPISETPLPEDLRAGDKVLFTFEVSWTGSPPMRLLSLEKLPPETVLSFEAPVEPAGEPMPEGTEPAESHSMDPDQSGHEDHGGLGHGGGDQTN